MNRIMKTILVIIGFFSMAIGVIGIIIPVLPTTPFLIVTSICFLRGSESFYSWFTGGKFYRKYVKDFTENRAMTRKKKICLLLFVNSLIILSILIVRNIYMTIGLVFIMIVKLWYFTFKIKTIEEPCKSLEEKTSGF